MVSLFFWGSSQEYVSDIFEKFREIKYPVGDDLLEEILIWQPG